MALLFVGATAARTSGCVLVPDPEPVASPPVIVVDSRCQTRFAEQQLLRQRVSGLTPIRK